MEIEDLLRVGDYVAVHGVDGKEYYGRVLSIIPSTESTSFRMQWLAPDKEKFKNALESKLPITPSDFRQDAPYHETTESVSCVKYIIASRSGFDFPNLSPASPIVDLSKYVTVSGERLNQNFHMGLICESEQISADEFSQLVSCMLTSHVKLFYNCFGSSFIEWLGWMKEQDLNRFRVYMIKAFKTEYLRANFLVHGGDISKINSISINSPETENIPGYIIDDDCSASDADAKTFRFMYSLFTRHFLDPFDFPARIRRFLLACIQFATENGLNPNLFGWCPLDSVHSCEFYTFHLNQLWRLSMLKKLELELKMGKRTPSTLMDMSMLMNVEQFDRRGPIINPSFQYCLIPKESWPEVYSKFFPFSTLPESHYSVYSHLEFLCCRVITHCMVDYLQTVLSDVKLNEQTTSSPISNQKQKENIKDYVEFKVTEEIKTRGTTGAEYFE